LWYAFTAGSVRVISLANDDVCYQDGGNSYVRGYSGGAQKHWLEQELERTRNDNGIDWIVVCMHQTAVSTGERTNGADLGIRENWLPLFDRFGVDLVVCGHEHHYERTHAVRGTLPTGHADADPGRRAIDHIDTSKGTVHLVIGGGGHVDRVRTRCSFRAAVPGPDGRRRRQSEDRAEDAAVCPGGRTVVGVP